MKLVVYELKTTLGQQIEIGNNILLIEAIRPHLYKHNSPAGSLYFEIRNEADALLFTSESLDIADIDADVSAAFFHGLVRFNIDASLAKTTKYNIILKSSGYTYSDSAYIGWCNGFDLKVVENSYTPIGDLKDALIMELWERKTLRKGQN